MPETVGCSECGASYDSESHPFCPRCGSTARGAPMPGAVASAARRSPGRRRVQASGFVLVAIGVFVLFSALAAFLVPIEDAVAGMDADDLERWSGGEVVVTFPLAENGTVQLLDNEGAERANRTEADGTVTLMAPEPRLQLVATQGAETWNYTVFVISGDRLAVDLGDPPAGEMLVGPLIRSVMTVAGYIALGFAALLIVGGVSAALLRVFPLAALAAGAAAAVGVLAVLALLVVGLLFAIPLGVSAYFILRGRQHFRGRAPAPPQPPAPGQQPPT